MPSTPAQRRSLALSRAPVPEDDDDLNADEQGIEQAGRREFSGEALGPIAHDRLFYFVAGQYVSLEPSARGRPTTSR